MNSIWNGIHNKGMCWRLNVCTALHGKPSQSYGASFAIWDHTMLPATRHKRPHLTLMPARVWYSVYLPGRDRRRSWPRWLITYQDGLPVCRQVTHPSSNWARRGATLLITTNTLSITPCHHHWHYKTQLPRTVYTTREYIMQNCLLLRGSYSKTCQLRPTALPVTKQVIHKQLPSPNTVSAYVVALIISDNSLSRPHSPFSLPWPLNLQSPPEKRSTN